MCIWIYSSIHYLTGSQIYAYDSIGRLTSYVRGDFDGYRLNDVLKALDRNEDVIILYHGKLKGVISSAARPSSLRVTEHSFFNMRKGSETVEETMENLRGARHRDL